MSDVIARTLLSILKFRNLLPPLAGLLIALQLTAVPAMAKEKGLIGNLSAPSSGREKTETTKPAKELTKEICPEDVRWISLAQRFPEQCGLDRPPASYNQQHRLDGVWDIYSTGDQPYAAVKIYVHMPGGTLPGGDPKQLPPATILSRQKGADQPGWVSGSIVLHEQKDGSVEAAYGQFKYCSCVPVVWRVRSTGDPDVMTGEWDFGGVKGATVWRRHSPQVTIRSVVVSRALPDAQGNLVDDRFSYGTRRGRLERTHPVTCGYGSMRGNCDRVWVTIWGDGFAGAHDVWLDPAYHMELGGTRWLCRNGGYQTDAWHGCDGTGEPGGGVTGLQTLLILRDGMKPGPLNLWVDGQPIPIDVVLNGYPEEKPATPALVSFEARNAQDEPVARIEEGVPFRLTATFDAAHPDAWTPVGLPELPKIEVAGKLVEQEVILQRESDPKRFHSEWMTLKRAVLHPFADASPGAQEGDQDPLSFARTPGYDAEASRTAAVAFAGKWRVAINDAGKIQSGVARVDGDGSAITLTLNESEGEVHYRSVEIDAMQFVAGTGPFTATLGVRFKKEVPAARKGEPTERRTKPLFIKRDQEGVTFDLGGKSLELGVDWADDSRDMLRMQIASRGDLGKLQGKWSAEVGDKLTGGGGASWVRGEPQVAGIIVVDDQSGLPPKYKYPFREDGTPIEHLMRTRTLVIYGSNLPEFADQAQVLPRSDNIDYGPDFRTGAIRDRVIRKAFEKAGIANAEAFDAFIAVASLKPGAAPGTAYLSVDGAIGAWPLLYSNQIAALRFVRSGDLANDVFFPGDVGYVRLSFRDYLPIDEIAISISRAERDKVEDGVLIARRLKDDDPALYNYMTGPVHFYHRSKKELSPPPDKGALRVPVLEGTVVTAELVDRAEALTMPPVAKATIFAKPDQLGTTWKEALSRVAVCYGESIDDFTSYSRQEATRVSHLIINDQEAGVAKKRNLSAGRKPGNDILLKKGDQAAAILIRDEFVKQTLAILPDFEQRSLRRDYAAAYRQQAKNSQSVAEQPFWNTLTATYVEKGRLWDSETTVPLRETLNEAEIARRFNISEAQAEAWAIDQTMAASVKQIALIHEAIKRATDAGNCDLGELLLIAGHRSPGIVGAILPRLVKLEEDAGPPRRQFWAPDNAARSFVQGLYIPGAAVRALKEYSEADTKVALAVGALVTMGTTAALEGAGYAGAALLTSFAADAVDLTVGALGVQKYRQGERNYDFARGATMTLGDAVLDQAISQRQSATMTALGVLLPTVSAGSKLSQLRYFKNVQRGKALFSVEENVLETLSDLKDADRAGLAGYYVDMLETVKKSGLRGLDANDRAAFEAFQKYFDQAGVVAPGTTRVGDDLARTASRAAAEAEEAAPGALRQPEPPRGDPRLDETINAPPPAGDPRLDPRGRDIVEVRADMPVDDSPPLPPVKTPPPDFSQTPPGSLSDHLTPREIQDLFEPTRKLTPEEIVQKADLIRSGRVPPEAAQGDPRVLKALDEVFGIKKKRPPFTPGGTVIEPGPRDPRLAETTDFPPPSDPRLAQTAELPPPDPDATLPPSSDPRLAETVDLAPPDPNATLPPLSDSQLGETVDSPLLPAGADPHATLPPSGEAVAAPAGRAIDASLQRQYNAALQDLADYKPGAAVRLEELNDARRWFESGTPEELAVAERIHRKMLDLGVPENKALIFGALHYRRSPGNFSQQVNEAEIIAKGIVFYGTRQVKAKELAAVTGISPTAARMVIENMVQELRPIPGRLDF